MSNKRNSKGHAAQKTGNHREHPARNFFYALYSVTNIFAFAVFFFALYKESLTARIPIMIVAGALLALALYVGVIRPLARRKR